MPQNYSEFQLQSNKVAGQAAERITTRVIMFSMDIIKFIAGFITTVIKSVLGK